MISSELLLYSIRSLIYDISVPHDLMLSGSIPRAPALTRAPPNMVIKLREKLQQWASKRTTDTQPLYIVYPLSTDTDHPEYEGHDAAVIQLFLDASRFLPP